MLFQTYVIFIKYLPGPMVIVSLIIIPLAIGIAGVYFGRLAMILLGDTVDHSDSTIFFKTKKRRMSYLIIVPIVGILMSILAAIEENLKNWRSIIYY